jgi:hypothetical protein
VVIPLIAATHTAAATAHREIVEATLRAKRAPTFEGDALFLRPHFPKGVSVAEVEQAAAVNAGKQR